MNDVAIYPAWKNAVQLFLSSGFKFGELVTNQWLRDAFEIGQDMTADDAKENQLRFLSAFCQFRDVLLEEHRIALACVQGHGYKVLHPSEQTRYAVSHHMSRVNKEMRNMARTMAFIRHDELTDAERRDNADAIAKAAQLAAMVRTNRIIPRVDIKRVNS